MTRLWCLCSFSLVAFSAAHPGHADELFIHRVFTTGASYGVGGGGFHGADARAFADFEATFAAFDAG